jgi:YqaJ-like viral recombinase domain
MEDPHDEMRTTAPLHPASDHVLPTVESLPPSNSQMVDDLDDQPYLETFDEELLLDMEMAVYEYIADHLKTNPLIIANENIQTLLIEESAGMLLNAMDIADCELEYEDVYDFVKERTSVFLETIIQTPRSLSDLSPSFHENDIHTKLQTVREAYQPQQRTKEWYEFRYNLLTATNIGKLLHSESSRNSVIVEKCAPLAESSRENLFVNVQSTLHWGHKYEPLSIMVYEHKNRTHVEEFGCIRHPQYNCIGASPDGINVDPTSAKYGRMTEVKNIVNREINGIPLTKYWIQMQMQMEVCDLELCDFIETRFKEYDTWDLMLEDSVHEYRGIILYFVHKSEQGGPHYVYMPLDIEINDTAIQKWIKSEQENLKSTHVLYNTLGWYLDEYSCVVVPRNREWFADALPVILETWSVIEKERVEGYSHRLPKARNSDQSANEQTKVTNVYKVNKLDSNPSQCMINVHEF